MSRPKLRYAGFCLLVVSLSEISFAGGLWFYETGTPETGMSGAGYSARAQDAATAYGNPAGMTRLTGLNALGGSMLGFFSLQFAVDSATFGGESGGNAGGFVPGFGLYYVNQLLPQRAPNLRVGYSLNSYVGGKLDYDDTWAGRFYAQETKLLTVHLNPVLAYELLPWLSLGGGLDLVTGKIEAKTAANNPFDPVPDGRIKVEQTSVGAGGDGGILFQISERFRFGVTYRSPVRLRYRSPPTVEGIGPILRDTLAARNLLGTEVNLDVKLPQQVQAGFYYVLLDGFSVMIEGNWQDWSEFGTIGFELPAPSATTLAFKKNLKDTWHAAIGMHYRLLPELAIMAGFGYDSSPIDKADRPPSFPVDRQFRYAGGVQWNLAQWVSLGASYEYAGLGKAEIDRNRGPLQGKLAGEYSSSHLNAVTMYAAVRL